MAKPIIALDIDDVLVDTADALLGDYNKKYGTLLKRHHYYSKDTTVLGVSDYNIAADRLMQYITSGALTKARPMMPAVHAIERLKVHYDFVAVTSRPSVIASATEEWLARHFDNTISRVIFTSFIMAASSATQGTSFTKAAACVEVGATSLIEDHLQHATSVADRGMEVFLIDQPWNQSETLLINVKRVEGWDEIERILAERAGVWK